MAFLEGGFPIVVLRVSITASYTSKRKSAAPGWRRRSHGATARSQSAKYQGRPCVLLQLLVGDIDEFFAYLEPIWRHINDCEVGIDAVDHAQAGDWQGAFLNQLRRAVL